MTGFIDAPRLRYRRILVPAAAYLLAGGQDRFVDAAYVAVVLFSLFLGAWWMSKCAIQVGRHPAWGLGFLAVPATLISIDRLVIDATLCAFVAGFVYYARQGPSWKVYLMLVCSVLTRETGVVLIGSYCLYLLCVRRFRLTALFATSAGPASVWFTYVHPRAGGNELAAALVSIRRRLPKLGPIAYRLPPVKAAVVVCLDYLSLAGIAVATGLAIRRGVRRPLTPEAVAGLGYAALGLWTYFVLIPGDPFTLPRVLSPLLMLVALNGSRAGWAAMAMVSLRVVVQLGPQAMGVLGGLF